MKRILITGANGFVGQHAVREFHRHGYEVFEGIGPEATPMHKQQIPINLLHYEIVRFVVDQLQPDLCLHLAGQAHIPFCQNDPVTANDLNVTGTVRLLESFRRHKADARVLIVTSGEVYGQVPQGHLVTERDPLTPTTLYGITKQAADEASLAFAAQLGLPVMTARPWNHIGPGQHPRFVAASFAHQMVKLKSDPDPLMRVGNLESKRDFTDVRDIVRGYRLLLEDGQAGEAYNLATSNLRPVRDLIQHLETVTGVHPRIEINPDFYRPTDSSPLLSTEKIRDATGWKPEIPLEQSMRDLVDSIEPID